MRVRVHRESSPPTTITCTYRHHDRRIQHQPPYPTNTESTTHTYTPQKQAYRELQKQQRQKQQQGGLPPPDGDVLGTADALEALVRVDQSEPLYCICQQVRTLGCAVLW